MGWGLVGGVAAATCQSCGAAIKSGWAVWHPDLGERALGSECAKHLLRGASRGLVQAGGKLPASWATTWGKSLGGTLWKRHRGLLLFVTAKRPGSFLVSVQRRGEWLAREWAESEQSALALAYFLSREVKAGE